MPFAGNCWLSGIAACNPRATTSWWLRANGLVITALAEAGAAEVAD